MFVCSEEGDLVKERQLRKRLERKLQIAEDSLKRLDGALRRSGVKLDVDVFADVKTLLAYFEERCVWHTVCSYAHEMAGVCLRILS